MAQAERDRAAYVTVWVEVFRKALMEAHADDWSMETVAEAAHICAEAIAAEHFGTGAGDSRD